MSLTWELLVPRIVAFEHAEQSRAQREAPPSRGHTSRRAAIYSDAGDPADWGDPLYCHAAVPLSTVSRRLRIAAIEMFPQLIDSLEAAVNSAVQSIENAEKFVK
jgi:hypothetical protein